MRCPHCHNPIPDYSINCPNCCRSIYDTKNLPAKTLRTEKIRNLKFVTISCEDSKTNINSNVSGYLYEENECFIILLSDFSILKDEISWVKNVSYAVIPKKIVTKIQGLRS